MFLNLRSRSTARSSSKRFYMSIVNESRDLIIMLILTQMTNQFKRVRHLTNFEQRESRLSNDNVHVNFHFQASRNDVDENNHSQKEKSLQTNSLTMKFEVRLSFKYFDVLYWCQTEIAWNFARTKVKKNRISRNQIDDIIESNIFMIWSIAKNQISLCQRTWTHDVVHEITFVSFLTSDRDSNNTSMWLKQRKAWFNQIMIDQWNVLRRQFNMFFSIVTSSFFLEETRKIIKLYFYHFVFSFDVKQLYDNLSDWRSSVMKFVKIHVEQFFIFKTYQNEHFIKTKTKHLLNMNKFIYFEKCSR